ncbi:MAG TPA: peroxiredoxin-like family protein [Actinocrinis sp.]|nr:peroxiredoxin-like family protein [Actinocrinis sp.]
MSANQTVAEKIVQVSEVAASRLPADVLAVFHAEQARFDAEGVPEGVLRPGEQMPDGKLLDVHGEPTSLGQVRNGRPAVVVFYRGDWCPYCNVTLHTYQEQVVAPLAERGVALVAVSPQKPDGSLTIKQKHELTFDVVSDPGNQLATALGILTKQGGTVREAQGKLGLDVAATNGDGTDFLPMPTVVVVDAAGAIRWVDVHPNFTTRTEPQQIFDAVAALGL